MSDLADSNLHPRCAKVAVVGSGLAGLTAAYLLSTVHQRADIRHNGGPVEYEVHVFEKVCARFPLPPLLAKFAYLFVIVPPRPLSRCTVMRLSGKYTRNGLSFSFIYAAR